VVITSVTRDDIDDGGAEHFVATIRMLREGLPTATIEVLTPDFQGSTDSIRRVCDAGPDVFNHNLETVARLTPLVRDGASYRRSLDVLAYAHAHGSVGRIKSGLMLGLGETRDEVLNTLKDLRDAGCSFVTIGQYLRPSRGALPVAAYLTPEVFNEYAEVGQSMGFTRVMAGPLVRSSYHAAYAMFDDV
jgi:lipoyl synthase